MSIFPTKILLATDGSEEATLAAKTAAGIAARTASELHVLIVGREDAYYELPETPARLQDVLEAQRRKVEEVLEGQVRKIEESGGSVEETHLRMGERPDRAIVDEGEKLGVRLIVVGSRGLGLLNRALMGSVSSSVVRHAHCPVLVVRDGEREGDYLLGRILLATDGSEEATLAAQTAADLAKRAGSELHLVTVAPQHPYMDAYYDFRHPAEVERRRQDAQKILNQQADRLLETGGSVAKAHLKMGRVDEEIVVLGEEIGADLIVTGSRGLGGMRRALMGSVSESVVHHASCPVLVVRKEE